MPELDIVHLGTRSYQARPYSYSVFSPKNTLGLDLWPEVTAALKSEPREVIAC